MCFGGKLWVFGVTLVAMTTYMKVHCPSGIIPSGVLPNYITTYGIFLHQASEVNFNATQVQFMY